MFEFNMQMLKGPFERDLAENSRPFDWSGRIQLW